MDNPTRIKRLAFRSSHRGSKETDILLGPYAVENLERMSDLELEEFEAFLNENDVDIWDWVIAGIEPATPKYQTLIPALRKRAELDK